MDAAFLKTFSLKIKIQKMLKIQQENSVKMIHFSFSFGEAFLPGLTNTSQMVGSVTLI